MPSRNLRTEEWIETLDLDLSAEELRFNPPSSTPFTWEGMNRLLHEGYCINSRGQVYSGQSAPQDAWDDLLNNSQVSGTVEGQLWLGRSTGNVTGDTYNGLKIAHDDLTRVTVQGMGNTTRLDGGTSEHGLFVENTQTGGGQLGCGRLRVKDIEVGTTAGGGSSKDAVHIRDAIEVRLISVTAQGSDRDAFHLEGGEQYMLTDCGTEGADRDCINIQDSGNDSLVDVQINGGRFDNPGSDTVIDIAEPNGNGVATVVIEGFIQRSGTGTAWLRTDSGVSNVVVGGTAKAAGGTTLNGGDVTTYGVQS